MPGSIGFRGVLPNVGRAVFRAKDAVTDIEKTCFGLKDAVTKVGKDLGLSS